MQSLLLRADARTTKVVVASLVFALAMHLATVRSSASAEVVNAGPELGAVGDLTWGISRAEIDRTIRDMQSAGITWVRANQSWAAAEPDAKGIPNDNWLVEVDYAVKAATTAGMQVLMPISDGVPFWASADPAKYVGPDGVRHWNNLWRPVSAGDYGDFAATMVRRYKPMGVSVYEIWNEPNHPRFWPSGPSATEYTEMLKAGYTSIKAADPTATVLLGGLSKNDWDYLAGVYAAGGGPYFDKVAVHPYTVNPNWCWNEAGTTRPAKDAFCGIEEIRRIMVANGDTAKSIWLTEFGWSTTTAEYGVTEADQSSFLTVALNQVKSSYPYVTHAFWYNFRNTYYMNDDPAEIEANFGLVRTDFTPKPAFDALKTFAATSTPPAPLPAMSVSDQTVVEGGAGGTAAAAFTISLSAPATGPVSVQAATADGTATSGADYTAVVATTVAFAPGETTRTLTVPVTGDSVYEGNETFLLNLSSPAGSVLADAQSLGTIFDDEGVPAVSVGNAPVLEGPSGSTANAAFILSMSPASARPVSVRAATAKGSAKAGSDYNGLAVTVNFAAGETTKTVSVGVIGDSVKEANETFVLNLSSPIGAVLADTQGLATIVNDDGLLGAVTAMPPPSISVSNATTVEGPSATSATATFTVSLSAASTGTVSVRVATANASATAGSDYVAKALATVAFATGETTKTVSVPVIGDSMIEANETFVLNLSSPVGSVLADSQGLGTILNDD